jgi:dUTP pyrophosphatase
MEGQVLQVRIKRVGNNADLPLPVKMTAHAAGFDVAAAVAEPTILQPGEIRLIPCGFAMALPEGYEAQMRPRSGLASKHGVSMINTPGTIDCDYRGEVHVPMINLGKVAFTVTRGMRIAQMVIQKLPAVDLLEVDDLDKTARGSGGFGHTGH